MHTGSWTKNSLGNKVLEFKSIKQPFSFKFPTLGANWGFRCFHGIKINKTAR